MGASDFQPAGYSQLRLLDRGGQGEVYHALDETGIPVAIKRLLALPRTDSILRFHREADALRACKHDGIVHLIEFNFVDPNSPYLVLPFVESPRSERKKPFGESLAAFLEGTRRHLSPEQVLEIGIQVADALAHMHSHGIVHRDLKLQNLLVRNPRVGNRLGFEVVISDLGIALVADKTRITPEGVSMGSVHTMAPEQLNSREYSKICDRTDVFALGCILHELFTGQQVFKSTNPHSRFFEISDSKPTAAALLSAGVSQEVADLVLQMIQYEVAARPTARDVASRLQRGLLDEAGALSNLLELSNRMHSAVGRLTLDYLAERKHAPGADALYLSNATHEIMKAIVQFWHFVAPDQSVLEVTLARMDSDGLIQELDFAYPLERFDDRTMGELRYPDATFSRALQSSGEDGLTIVCSCTEEARKSPNGQYRPTSWMPHSQPGSILAFTVGVNEKSKLSQVVCIYVDRDYFFSPGSVRLYRRLVTPFREKLAEILAFAAVP
ncbi:protein kinase [bacterium]|nr:protein kinase [bacterium]